MPSKRRPGGGYSFLMRDDADERSVLRALGWLLALSTLPSGFVYSAFIVGWEAAADRLVSSSSSLAFEELMTLVLLAAVLRYVRSAYGSSKRWAIVAAVLWTMGIGSWLAFAFPVRVGVYQEWLWRHLGPLSLTSHVVYCLALAVLLASVLRGRADRAKAIYIGLTVPLIVLWALSVAAFAATVFGDFAEWQKQFWFGMLCYEAANLALAIAILIWCRAPGTFAVWDGATETQSLHRSVRGLTLCRLGLSSCWWVVAVTILITSVAPAVGNAGTIVLDPLIRVMPVAVMLLAGLITAGLYRYASLPSAAGGRALGAVAFALTFGAFMAGSEIAIIHIVRSLTDWQPSLSQQWMSDLTPLFWTAYAGAGVGALVFIVSLARVARTLGAANRWGSLPIVALVMGIALGVPIGRSIDFTDNERLIFNLVIFAVATVTVRLTLRLARILEQALRTRASAVAF